jgi:hypothetical protein
VCVCGRGVFELQWACPGGGSRDRTPPNAWGLLYAEADYVGLYKSEEELAQLQPAPPPAVKGRRRWHPPFPTQGASQRKQNGFQQKGVLDPYPYRMVFFGERQ